MKALLTCLTHQSTFMAPYGYGLLANQISQFHSNRNSMMSSKSSHSHLNTQIKIRLSFPRKISLFFLAFCPSILGTSKSSITIFVQAWFRFNYMFLMARFHSSRF